MIIKRRGGETFSIVFRRPTKSPPTVRGIRTRAATEDILEAVRESRERIEGTDGGA